MRPVIEVNETSRGDWVIRIRSDGPEEHLTLHAREGKAPLLTHRSRGKPKSVWDEGRVRAARKLGYKNPERHGDYYQHRDLVPFSATNGEFLVGKKIDIASATWKARHARMESVAITVPGTPFMLGIHLFGAGHRASHEQPHVMIGPGELCFSAGPLKGPNA